MEERKVLHMGGKAATIYQSDRGKFYKFVSRILNIGHAKEEVFLMNEQGGISHVKILPSSLFKHLL